MMVKCKTAIVAFLWLLGVFVFESCKNEDPVCDVDITSKETVLRMRMNITKSSFDLNAETRSETATEWKDNDIVYIHFKTDTGTIPAKATFSVAENDWTVRYNGVLPQGNNLSCTATYFEKIDSVSSTSVYISPETAIYCDTVATYTFASGRELEVSATLMPETGRIRFKGESNLKFALVGITNYCRYSIEENKLVKDSTNTIWAEVLADGFTPYYYGMFTDSVAPSLDIVYSGNRYNASMPNTIFRRGESGWMNVPTGENHNEWNQSSRISLSLEDLRTTMIYSSDGLSFSAPTYSSRFFALINDTMTFNTSWTVQVGTSNDPYFQNILLIEFLNEHNDTSYSYLVRQKENGNVQLGIPFSGVNRIRISANTHYNKYHPHSVALKNISICPNY